MLIISWFIIGFITNLFYCYLFTKVTSNDKFKVNCKVIFYCCIATIFCIIINDMALNYGLNFRPILINIVFIFLLYFVYKKNSQQIILTAIVFAIIFAISEVIVGFILFKIINFDSNFLEKNVIGVLICNALIFLFVWLIYILFRKMITNLINITSRNEIFRNIILFIIIVFSISFLLKENLANSSSVSIFLITDVFVMCVIFLVFLLLQESSEKHKIDIKYETYLQYGTTLEEIADEKSKIFHEYKNQLALLKTMVSKNNTKAIDYIDKILKENKNIVKYSSINKLKNIKLNSLKGFIYYEIRKMSNLNIELSIDISSELNQKKIWNVCERYLDDVSKVIGVCLDNAMEAAVLSKQKIVSLVCFKEDNNIVFLISNTYEKLDIDKLGVKKYTTKGKDRGYGLSLVKDIINKNNCIFVESEVKENFYIKRIIIMGQ